MKITRRGLLGSLLASPLIAKPTSLRKTFKLFSGTRHGFWLTLREPEGNEIAANQLTNVVVRDGVLFADDSTFRAVVPGYVVDSIGIWKDGQQIATIRHGWGLGLITNGGDVNICFERGKGICEVPEN